MQTGDVGLRQGRVIQSRGHERPREHPIATHGFVATAKQRHRLLNLEPLQRAVVGRAISDPVAKQGDAAGLGIADGELHDLCIGLFFRGAIYVARALELVASGHPPLRLPLAIDDRIEPLAFEGLD